MTPGPSGLDAFRFVLAHTGHPHTPEASSGPSLELLVVGTVVLGAVAAGILFALRRYRT